MAYSPAPISPTHPSSHLRSTSPPTQPLSKRDKRRVVLSEKVEDLTNSFSQNREGHFRHYVKALQHEMNLIINADPYTVGPMEDSGEEIAKMVAEAAANTPYSTGMTSLAGSWYGKFVQEVNAAKEETDTELALISKRHERNLLRLEYERDFKMHFAREEFKELSSTIRERLMQAITTRKARLLREKDALNIVDTNSLLLHPSQFSITNPASPGGAQSNRKTRHTRHRVDVDDIANGFPEGVINKRKRKLPLEEEIGSPARDSHYGVVTPAERIKRQMLTHQTSPLISINSLFTDKELTLHGNAAHVATVHHFASHKYTNGVDSGAVTNGINSDDEDGASEVDNNGREEASAPDMARTASQTFHMTRSSRNGAGGLNLLGDLAEKSRSLPYYALRTHVPYLDRAPVAGKGAPLLTPLMPEEVHEDISFLERLSDKPPGWVDKKLVGKLSLPLNKQSRYSTLHPDYPANLDVHLVDAEISRKLREKDRS